MGAESLRLTGGCLMATAFVWGLVRYLGNQDESLRAALRVRPLAVPPPGQPSCT